MTEKFGESYDQLTNKGEQIMNVKFFNNYPFRKEFILLELSINELENLQYITFALLGFGFVITRYIGRV